MEAQKLKRQAPKEYSRPDAQSSSLTVREKIFKAQYEHIPHKKGPELELFFHELTDKETTPKRVFDLVFAIMGFILMIILYPLIALGIKLSSKGPVIQSILSTGKSGAQFNRYEFRTMENTDAVKQHFFGFGRFLHNTGLHKLPLMINVFKNQLSIVGPEVHDQTTVIQWNNTFDDFYKRYAVSPGVIPVHAAGNQVSNEKSIEQQLKKEFKYIVSPTLKRDWKILFGNS